MNAKIKSRSFIVVAACSSLVVLAACEGERVDSTPLAPVEAPGPRGLIDQSELTDRVRSALAAEPALDASNINVVVDGGRVTLSGTMPVTQIPRAEATVREVEGVNEVVNRLSAADSAPQPPQGGTS